jgi:hypothetical protein
MKPVLITVFAALSLAACASVDVTKTSAGYREPTDPNTIEILKTRPTRPFIELGSVTATGFNRTEEAVMHNGIRTKSAALGANAVILTSEGMVPEGYGQYSRWASGVAIAYTGR